MGIIQIALCISLYANAQGNHLITPSKATSAIAFAGNARKKHGKNPLQYPFQPPSRPTAIAASFHRRNRRSPSPWAPPRGSVMSLFLTTSEGYDVIQKIWAESPPAQKLIAGAGSAVFSRMNREIISYEPHQKKKNDRNKSVAQSPRNKPRIPWLRSYYQISMATYIRREGLTIFLVQSIGPLYIRCFLSAAYWICNRALTCSTGAAMKLTVHPASIPAIPCPNAGSVFGFDPLQNGMVSRTRGFENTFSNSRRRYSVSEPSILQPN